MALHHSEPGEVLNLESLNADLPKNGTFALVKTEHMEVIRMFLPAGKEIPNHQVAGEITVQCLSGRIRFTVDGSPREMSRGEWLYLSGSQDHALEAIEDSVLLVTIQLRPKD